MQRSVIIIRGIPLYGGLMPRHRNPDYNRTLTVRVSKGRYYASAKTLYTSEKDGKVKINDVYYGSLELLSGNSEYKYFFHPNDAFLLLSQKERDNLIYPDDWDLTECEKLARKAEEQDMDIVSAIDQSFLYGDIMLMNKIAEDTKIISHLNKISDGNERFVRDTLTLAYHMFLTKHSWNRVAKWQLISKTPTPASEISMSASYITQFTQKITEQHRSDLIRLRLGMIGDDDLVCIDSTTHSGYGGKRICEIDFGHNKDDKQLPCTVETMAYSLNSHTPVYYQTFQGNMVDVRTTEFVMNELKELGFNNKVVTCTDRGYFCADELEWHIKHGIPLITFAKVDSKLVKKHIPDISFTGAPCGMEIDPVERIYCDQYDEEYCFTDEDGNEYSADLKVNIYFNPLFRTPKQTDMDIKIKEEQDRLAEITAQRRCLSDEEVKKFKYHTVIRDPNTGEAIEFCANEAKIRKSQKTFGFYAIITYKLDEYKPLPVLKIYALRGEQEQCFEIEKEVNGQDKHNCWSEDGLYGRRFITFIGNILVSHARSKWRNEQELYDEFDSTADMFDTMRPIKWVAHKGSKPKITPLIKDQVLIAEKFGIEIPDYALPTQKRTKPVMKTSHKVHNKTPKKKHSSY